MNAEELNNKYLDILDYIKYQQVISPQTKNDNSPENWYELNNYTFDIPEGDFKEIMLGLEKQKVIEITGIINVPENSPRVNGWLYDENGDLVDSDEIIFNYWNVDTQKLEDLREKIPETITTQEEEFIQMAEGRVILSAGDLSLHEGGAISYDGEVIKIPQYLKTILEYFMEHPNRIYDRDTLIEIGGIRTDNKKKTVAKYVWKINKILKPHYKRYAIVNHKREGWIFHP